MAPKDLIRENATGSFLFINSTRLNGIEKDTTERAGQFRVTKVRSKDFIIETIDGTKTIFCGFPKNRKPKTSRNGNILVTESETFEMTPRVPGYMRFIRVAMAPESSPDISEHLATVTMKFHGLA